MRIIVRSLPDKEEYNDVISYLLTNTFNRFRANIL